MPLGQAVGHETVGGGSGRHPATGAEGEHGRLLAGAELDHEAAMLALRTRGGVPAGPAADGLVTDGLAERHGSRIVLTPAGRLLANEATTRLLGASTC